MLQTSFILMLKEIWGFGLLPKGKIKQNNGHRKAFMIFKNFLEKKIGICNYLEQYIIGEQG